MLCSQWLANAEISKMSETGDVQISTFPILSQNYVEVRDVFLWENNEDSFYVIHKIRKQNITIHNMFIYYTG